MFPVKVENDLVIIYPESHQVEHADVVETLTFLADNASDYQNKKLLILDPGSDYNPSPEALQHFIYLIKLLLGNPFSQIALVVSKDLHYGLGRMTEGQTEIENGQFCVFKNEDDARDWLSA